MITPNHYTQGGHNMIDDIKKVLLSEEEITGLARRLAAEISQDYEGKKLVVVGTLKGALPFMCELIKYITLPLELDFMKVSSYGAGTKSSGELKVLLDLNRDDLADCDILIVEDIVDSGNTLSKLTNLLRSRGARSVKTAALLDKPSRRVIDFQADYVGAIVPDYFVVGFGLDYNEKYRNLPFVGILKEEVYSN